MELVVARIGRPHGLAGEVSVELRTDVPEERLAVGAALATDPPSVGPLTVTRAREQAGRWYLSFAEATDRTAAEGLRGVLLVVEEDASDEADAWYPHELAGLRAERPDGTEIGTVVRIENLPAQDLLVVREGNGTESRIPFVSALVPVVDVPGGRIVVDPPYGLLDGETTEGEEADDAN
ncbi:MAG: ribosome maturation factor RimM [Demequinaceae bacterium]|nr:ribosome maturation factor RimM [Demequinaceae bacterium]